MESNKSQPDSAVSPTISAGEAQMSFDAWWSSWLQGYTQEVTDVELRMQKYSCEAAWEARDVQANEGFARLEDKLYSSAMEVTALKQELAQAKEEAQRLSGCNISLIVERNGLSNALQLERNCVAALEGKLGEMRETHVPRRELEAESAAVNQVANERDNLRELLLNLCDEFKGIMQSEFETTNNPNPERKNLCYVLAREALSL